ncbi:MAG: hypothetical protein WCJ03_06415 [Bacteroidales bacterium]
MRKTFIYFIVLLSFIACASNDKDAEDRLKLAKNLCKAGLYNTAKLEIDSIRSLYPTSYKVIKQAVILNREVERLEQSRNSIYCDKIISELSQKAAELQEDFVFEKEVQYQDIGNWVLPSQRVERNLQRSYLRCGVSEKGEMYIVAVYCGVIPIRYNSIRVSTTEGTFAESLTVANDGANNFSFVDNGMTTQIVSFTHKNENGISGFVRLYAHQRIKVDYLGGKPFGFLLDEETKKSVLKTYALSQVMTDLNHFKQEKSVADRKLIYLEKKRQKI